MPNAFVDSNILIYAAEETLPTPRKTTIAREVLQCEHLHLSVQVLNEFTANARKPNKLGLPKDRERGWIDSFLLFEVTAITASIYLSALEIHDRYGLSHWDALILAAAIESHCEVLYSENLQHGQIIEGVLVVNPFV
ncbi:MAG: PIN domain-containing protein [Akkermansiaceae bacterium]|nr:PIN domain-containing protein [Akkermansiaceae bacterium]